MNCIYAPPPGACLDLQYQHINSKHGLSVCFRRRVFLRTISFSNHRFLERKKWLEFIHLEEGGIYGRHFSGKCFTNLGLLNGECDVVPSLYIVWASPSVSNIILYTIKCLPMTILQLIFTISAVDTHHWLTILPTITIAYKSLVTPGQMTWNARSLIANGQDFLS